MALADVSIIVVFWAIEVFDVGIVEVDIVIACVLDEVRPIVVVDWVVVVDKEVVLMAEYIVAWVEVVVVGVTILLAVVAGLIIVVVVVVE